MGQKPEHISRAITVIIQDGEIVFTEINVREIQAIKESEIMLLRKSPHLNMLCTSSRN